ncbi:MAG: hypothetical protein K0M67_15815 [Thiobacillus sp.]|nr:hypothetical protein [Thiobacillus sp.]
MLKNPPPISLDPHWRELIFGSSPAREVMGRSRPTMRFRSIDHNDVLIHQEGGNEHTAWLLLSHLMRVGLVRRFKFQPFNFADYGGPKGFPDLLVELASSDLVVLEVKSAKYVTAEFLESLRERDSLIESMGMACRLWSDRKVASATTALSVHIRNNLLDINRCKEIPIEREFLEALRRATMTGPITLAALLDATGAHWEQLMSALAANHISISLEEKLHEASVIKPPATPRTYEHYFSQRPGSQGWWRSLPNLDLDCNDCSA